MAFERDLGYLDKFFDNLDAHAATLGGDAGARLKQLVGEERARWTEIRGLLAAPSSGGKASKGAAPKATEAPKPAAAPKPKEAPATTQAADVTAAATRLPTAGFTVGSLRGR